MSAEKLRAEVAQRPTRNWRFEAKTASFDWSPTTDLTRGKSNAAMRVKNARLSFMK